MGIDLEAIEALIRKAIASLYLGSSPTFHVREGEAVSPDGTRIESIHVVIVIVNRDEVSRLTELSCRIEQIFAAYATMHHRYIHIIGK